MTIIERDILTAIRPWLGKKKILIIKGARQTGKTTLIKKLQLELTEKGFITSYFALDLEISNPIFSDPKLFIKYIKDQFNEKYVYIFLDEFQYIQKAGLFLKVVFDALSEGTQFIVSGSSSLEITKSSEFLTGRKIDFSLTTFNFREFLRARSSYNFTEDFDLTDIINIDEFRKVYKDELKNQLTAYLRYGGYPEIVLTDNPEAKKVLLQELIGTYIRKDVSGFLKIENISAFNNLIRILCSQIGNLINKSGLAGSLNINHETVTKYLSILEGTYVFHFLHPFFTNVRKEISKMPKVYMSDVGIKKYTLNEPDQNIFELINAAVIENYVCRSLISKWGTDRVYYYRTISKAEIDFIVKGEQTLLPIEVKFTGKPPKTQSVSFKNFSSEYPDAVTKIIITRDTFFYNKDQSLFLIPVYLWDFIRIH
ncbi:MAG: ATP-binding protein [Spirochaetota bacterium]